MHWLKKFWADNSLSIVIFGLFIVILIAMSIVGWRSNSDELQTHYEQPPTYTEYVVSGDFVEGVFENWESEFLQMWALVVLTIFLRQKGSSESKPIRKKTPQDSSSRLSILQSSTWRMRGRAIRHELYARSLGLSLLTLFIFSFMFHALGGTSAYNEEARLHGEQLLGVWEFVSTSEFWYQSLQNWQSEFLAVGVLLILTIKLRERGSEQSKPVGKRYDSKTGAS